MTNSDTTYGVYNKQSREIRFYNGGTLENPTPTVVTQSFGGNVETAKSFFFTDDALACFNTNATQLAWAITDDGNGIKFTMAFGVPKDPAVTPWADAWKNTNSALKDANNWIKSASYNAETQIWKVDSVDSHLF